MYVIIAPIQVKEGHIAQFMEAIIEDAKGSVNDEPGCRRFDVVQDAGDPSRVWLYEVYDDEAAFQAHTEAPHFIKFRDATQDIRVEGIQGAPHGAAATSGPRTASGSSGDWFTTEVIRAVSLITPAFSAVNYYVPHGLARRPRFGCREPQSRCHRVL